MPSLPVIDGDAVRHAANAPDGGAFDAPVVAPAEGALHDYLCRLGDDALILGQRLSEWCGHAPAVEVDLSLANIALDLIGQATHWLTLAAGDGDGADRLAFHRDVLDWKNCWLVEQPNGDFARTMARQWLYSEWQLRLLARLTTSTHDGIAAIAAKAVKEVAYHRDLAVDWVVRLGDGTDDSHRRMAGAIAVCWPYVAELFEVDAVVEELAGRGIAADPRLFEADYRAAVAATLAEAGIAVPAETRPILGGRRGHHSEHLGHLLAVMQHLPRSYPDARW